MGIGDATDDEAAGVAGVPRPGAGASAARTVAATAGGVD